MRLRVLSVLLVPCLAACATNEPDEPLGESRAAITVCPGASTLKGIDISHYDGTIDWAQVKASGRVFAFAKATEGTTYTDPTFATNWAAMQQHGVVRSAYHFFHSNMDPIVEADHLLTVMGPLQPGDLPPTLDLEVTDGQSAATITSTTIAWLDHIAAATGMKPILYTSPSFVTGSMGSPAGLENHAQLWIANWGVMCPDVPAPFTMWPFWQDSSTGTVPGIAGSGNVDIDVFNGTMAQLTALTKPGSTSSSTTSSSSSSSASTGATSGTGSASTSSTSTGSPSTSTTSSGAGGGGGAGGGSGLTNPRTGCTCTTASDESVSPAAWLVVAGLGVAVTRRRRATRV